MPEETKVFVLSEGGDLYAELITRHGSPSIVFIYIDSTVGLYVIQKILPFTGIEL